MGLLRRADSRGYKNKPFGCKKCHFDTKKMLLSARLGHFLHVRAHYQRVPNLQASARLSGIHALETVLTWPRRKSALPSHLDTGERGELAALFHLQRAGYVVTARRWRTPKQRGDIDLIGWEQDTLCFIEVKTRTCRDIATAESSVDEDKRKVLRRVARQYLKGIHPPPEFVRFDVLVIYLLQEKSEWMLYRHAFDW